jgi:hypothetical protein
VAGEIVFAEIGFGFHDDTARDSGRGPAFEYSAEHLTGDDFGLARIEAGREDTAPIEPRARLRTQKTRRRIFWVRIS